MLIDKIKMPRPEITVTCCLTKMSDNKIKTANTIKSNEIK